jgi:TolA-binding protein
MRIERMMRAGVVVLGVVGALPLAAQQGVVPRAEVAAPLAPATAQVNEAYDTATVALDRGDYGRAIDLFSDIVSQKGDRADAALYWVAYAQQRQGDG